jgi:hypothetical protein
MANAALFARETESWTVLTFDHRTSPMTLTKLLKNYLFRFKPSRNDLLVFGCDICMDLPLAQILQDF